MLTRLELEDTLLRLWDELGTTILFITHDIEEAIYLSDRIWVLSRRPAEIIEELRIDFPRPRHQLRHASEGRFMEIRNQIYKQISNENTANGSGKFNWTGWLVFGLLLLLWEGGSRSSLKLQLYIPRLARLSLPSVT
jgi:ABC-type sulfate/molybdate transport systems ATPase subunit